MKTRRIIYQVEYYFGDKNLKKDGFLKREMEKDDGWVSLECLLNFNRMKDLDVDIVQIAAALDKSETGLLEIHENRDKIRRCCPMMMTDEEVEKLHVHVQGFLVYSRDQVTILNDNHPLSSILCTWKDSLVLGFLQ